MANIKHIPPIWKIGETHPEKVSDLTEGLSSITDPELGFTILELGLIRNIEISDEHAQITMILTTPYCPYGPSMMEATRKNAEAILGLPTSIKYGTEVWDTTMMEDGLINDDWGLYD